VADCDLKFAATFDAYAQASTELARVLDARRLRPGPRYKVELVFEEIVSNIIRHGCARKPDCKVEVSVAFGAGVIVLDFHDDGQPFDPRDHAVADAPHTLDDAGHGGLGLLLVRKASATIAYERARDLNHLTVTIAA
jgi:anti-sigma regulatory factor (Ser/Thr protein kinase)